MGLIYNNIKLVKFVCQEVWENKTKKFTELLLTHHTHTLKICKGESLAHIASDTSSGPKATVSFGK